MVQVFYKVIDTRNSETIRDGLSKYAAKKHAQLKNNQAWRDSGELDSPFEVRVVNVKR